MAPLPDAIIGQGFSCVSLAEKNIRFLLGLTDISVSKRFQRDFYFLSSKDGFRFDDSHCHCSTMREPDTFLLLLTGFVIGINGRRLEGSLKWLGSRNQNSDPEFLPERDSIQVPVTIVQGKSEIIIDRNPISPNNSIHTFSLLSLLSKGSKGSNPHFALHSLDTRRVSTRSR